MSHFIFLVSNLGRFIHSVERRLRLRWSRSPLLLGARFSGGTRRRRHSVGRGRNRFTQRRCVIRRSCCRRRLRRHLAQHETAIAFGHSFFGQTLGEEDRWRRSGRNGLDNWRRRSRLFRPRRWNTPVSCAVTANAAITHALRNPIIVKTKNNKKQRLGQTFETFHR